MSEATEGSTRQFVRRTAMLPVYGALIATLGFLLISPAVKIASIPGPVLLALLPIALWLLSSNLRAGLATLRGLTQAVSQREQQVLRLTEEKAIAERLNNAAPVIVLSLDHEGRIQHVNPHFERITGWKLAEIQGADWFSTCLPKRNRESVRAIFERIGDAERVPNYTNPIITRDGEERLIEWNNELLLDAQGNVSGALAVGIDISERSRAEAAQRRSESKFLALFEQSTVGIVMGDMREKLELANQRFCDIVGYSIDEMRAISPKELVHPDDWPRDELLNGQMLRGEIDGYEVEKRYIRKDGTCIWVHLAVNATRSENGLSDILCVIQDITARKRTEDQIAAALQEKQSLLEELQRSESKFRALFEQASVGILVGDVNRNFVLVNQHLCEMTGYSKEELLALGPRRLVHPDDWAIDLEQVEQLQLRQIRYFQVEKRYVRKSGEHMWVNLTTTGNWQDDKLIEVTCVVQDIDARKLAQEQLRASLREKDTLLREIHHRVKNNLQIVSSLLYFQAKKFSEPQHLEVFTEARDRLRAMSLVHEQLYRSKELSNIQIDAYLKSLLDQLQRSFRDSSEHFRIDMDLQELVAPVEVALPCGMIVSELVSNAFKYAYPGEMRGAAQVTLRRTATGFNLSVSDQGVGLPENFDPSRAETFGMQLITGLQAQLDATLVLEHETGTRISLEIPLAGESS